MLDFDESRNTMVDTQIRPSDVTKFPIIDAMLKIKRETFVPNKFKQSAYADKICDLEGARFMLAPRDFAKLLDAVNVQPDEFVLDLGCGLGYSSAVLGHMAQAVVAVEEDANMAAEAQSILSSQNILNVAVSGGSLAAGDSADAPFDVIVIEGAVQQIPSNLLDQLAENGRIAAIFDAPGMGMLKIGHKKFEKITWRFICNMYAPVLAGFEKKLQFSL